jgi:hypothetical protein
MELVEPRVLLRRAVYEAEMVLQEARFRSLPAPEGGWPALLGVSFPKSGTHLLDQILLGFSRVAPFSRRLHSFFAEFAGETGIKRPPSEALAWIGALGPRDIGSAHLFARPEVVLEVARARFVPYFIFRDPRDVVVSHVFYVTEMAPRHVHHAYYASLPDLDTRLMVSIRGRPELKIEFPDIAGRFSPYMGWLDCDEVLKLHFEDFVSDRHGLLENVLDHFLKRVPLNQDRKEILKELETSIDPSRSPTFRSGKTGEWRRYFKPEHRDVFKEVAGDLLLRLGYESDDSW